MGASLGRHEIWRARVLRWKQLYPDPRIVRGKYDPSKVSATPLRCKKCGATEGVTRHHKGHEYLFACVMPEWYAARYVRFDRSDWVPLCTDRCHVRIHELYAPIVDEIKLYINDCLADSSHEGPFSTYVWLHRPDRRVLESFRKRLIAKCDWWLKQGNRKTRRGRYRSHR